MDECNAISVGELGLQWLGTSVHGSVVAKFENSLYARFESDVFVCIGAQAIGAGPLNVLLDAGDWLRVDAVPLGERVEAHAGALEIGHRVRVALTGATPWRPRRAGAAPDTVRQNLRTLLPIAQRMAPGMGLSRLAFAPASGGDADPLVAFARPAWDALEAWLACCAAPGWKGDAPAPLTSRLIGLGPGLTPSGDDVFCGVLIALDLLERDRAAAALWSWLLPQLEQRTSALSAAHLRAAAMGQGHAALHAVLECLGDDATASDEALRALGQVGHSSGWDALAGALLACRAHAAQEATSRIASSAA